MNVAFLEGGKVAVSWGRSALGYRITITFPTYAAFAAFVSSHASDKECVNAIHAMAQAPGVRVPHGWSHV